MGADDHGIGDCSGDAIRRMCGTIWCNVTAKNINGIGRINTDIGHNPPCCPGAGGIKGPVITGGFTGGSHPGEDLLGIAVTGYLFHPAE